MIPNAVASTGPYAGLWSHLKSIDHALDRVLNAPSANGLTELDKERLQALAQLLRQGISPDDTSSPPPFDLFVRSNGVEPEYGSGFDLITRIKSVPEFDAWRKAARPGFEQKLQSLIDSPEAFVGRLSTSLFVKDVPRAEFQILKAIVQSLLFDAEASILDCTVSIVLEKSRNSVWRRKVTLGKFRCRCNHLPTALPLFR